MNKLENFVFVPPTLVSFLYITGSISVLVTYIFLRIAVIKIFGVESLIIKYISTAGVVVFFHCIVLFLGYRWREKRMPIKMWKKRIETRQLIYLLSGFILCCVIAFPVFEWLGQMGGQEYFTFKDSVIFVVFLCIQLGIAGDWLRFFRSYTEYELDSSRSSAEDGPIKNP